MKKFLAVSALIVAMTTPILPLPAQALPCAFLVRGCGSGYGGGYGGSGGGYGGSGSGSGSSSGGKSGGSDAGQCVYTCTPENGIEVCRGNGPQCNDIDPYERERTNEERPNRRDRTDGGNP